MDVLSCIEHGLFESRKRSSCACCSMLLGTGPAPQLNDLRNDGLPIRRLDSVVDVSSLILE